MTDPDPLVEQWYDYLRYDRGRSERTIRTYKSTLDELPDPATASRDEVEAWWLGTRHLAPASRAAKLSALRSFYRWCTRWEHRPDDPTRRLEAPKVRNAAPHPLTREEVQLLLDESPDDIRRAVALCAFAGLRVAEAASLDWRDIDRETHRITIRGGKGNKDRSVGLPARLLDELGMTRRAGNVVRPDGRPYTANALALAINRAMKAAGIENTSHGLRGRYATMALTSANLVSVARAMGHAHMSTTARYTATSDADLDVIGEAVTRGF